MAVYQLSSDWSSAAVVSESADLEAFAREKASAIVSCPSARLRFMLEY